MTLFWLVLGIVQGQEGFLLVAKRNDTTAGKAEMQAKLTTRIKSYREKSLCQVCEEPCIPYR